MVTREVVAQEVVAQAAVVQGVAPLGKVPFGMTGRNGNQKGQSVRRDRGVLTRIRVGAAGLGVADNGQRQGGHRQSVMMTFVPIWIRSSK